MASLAEPNSAVGSDKRIRILFMHGLEGGYNTSRKVRVLEKYFTVNVPNMSLIVSGHIKPRKHSHILWIFFAAVFLALILIGWALVNMVQNNTLNNGMVFITSIIASFMGLLTLLRYIIDRLFDRCCKLQLQAIEEFRPDIVVGSSFGGGIAMHCLLRKYWIGPTVLLAPAQGLFCRLTLRNFVNKYRKELNEIDKQIPITVIHGTDDKVIPLIYSEQLISALNENRAPHQLAKLTVVQDSHPLNNYFSSQVAKELIKSMLGKADGHSNGSHGTINNA